MSLIIRLGASPSRLTSAHLQHTPIFYRLDALPAAQPTVSKQVLLYNGHKTVMRVYVNWTCACEAVLKLVLLYVFMSLCLQCFDTVGWASGIASSLKKNKVMRCWCGYLCEARCWLTLVVMEKRLSLSNGCVSVSLLRACEVCLLSCICRTNRKCCG